MINRQIQVIANVKLATFNGICFREATGGQTYLNDRSHLKRRSDLINTVIADRPILFLSGLSFIIKGCCFYYSNIFIFFIYSLNQSPPNLTHSMCSVEVDKGLY